MGSQERTISVYCLDNGVDMKMLGMEASALLDDITNSTSDCTFGDGFTGMLKNVELVQLSPRKIEISEIFFDGKNDWVELHSTSNLNTHLVNWYIVDSKEKRYYLPEGTISGEVLSPNAYRIITPTKVFGFGKEDSLFLFDSCNSLQDGLTWSIPKIVKEIPKVIIRLSKDSKCLNASQFKFGVSFYTSIITSKGKQNCASDDSASDDSVTSIAADTKIILAFMILW